MASKLEQNIAQSFRAILDAMPSGADISFSEGFRDVLGSLEYFIPDVLGEIYVTWQYSGLDGIYPVLARKTGDLEVELFGLCCIVCDQTLTPIHLRFQLSAYDDEICWMECRLGERRGHEMVKMPYKALNQANKRLYALEGKIDGIDWVYKATFGEKRRSQKVTPTVKLHDRGQ